MVVLPKNIVVFADNTPNNSYSVSLRIVYLSTIRLSINIKYFLFANQLVFRLFL